MGADEGRPTQGTPTTGTPGRRQGAGEGEGKGGKGQRSQCGTGPPSSDDLPRLGCAILVESAGRILLCFSKIVLMIHVLNFIPVP